MRSCRTGGSMAHRKWLGHALKAAIVVVGGLPLACGSGAEVTLQGAAHDGGVPETSDGGVLDGNQSLDGAGALAADGGAPSTGACGGGGEACTFGTDCCTGACINGA